MIRYDKYIIIIFMNINGNFRNEKKSRKIMRCIYKATHIIAAINQKSQNVVPKIVSECDQEITQSQTADKPMAS